MVLAMALAWGVYQSDTFAQQTTPKEPKFKGKVTNAERKEAAKRAAKQGVLPGIAGLEAANGAVPLPADQGGPGGTAHYFGPYGNWAFSPLPKGPIAVVSVVDGGGG
jgi:hypothetical protein